MLSSGQVSKARFGPGAQEIFSQENQAEVITSFPFLVWNSHDLRSPMLFHAAETTVRF